MYRYPYIKLIGPDIQYTVLHVFAAYHFIANRNADEFLNSIVAKTQANHGLELN